MHVWDFFSWVSTLSVYVYIAPQKQNLDLKFKSYFLA